jgi:hypothetical protein
VGLPGGFAFDGWVGCVAYAVFSQAGVVEVGFLLLVAIYLVILDTINFIAA